MKYIWQHQRHHRLTPVKWATAVCSPFFGQDLLEISPALSYFLLEALSYACPTELGMIGGFASE